MTASNYVRYALYAFLLIFTVLLPVNGQPLSPTFRLANTAGSVVPVGLLLFENFIWRWRLLQSLSFFPIPDVSGTWKGELLSNFPNGDGTPRAPIETYIVVRQSFFWISVRQYTRESASQLITGSICCERDGVKQLIGVYRNEPRFEQRDHSPIHFGSFRYDIEGRPVARLDGHYWTDRTTGGTAIFVARSRVVADSFDSARRLWETSPTEVATVGS
jgi:hypothetical protein